jgi:hypothetical protein
MAVAVVNPGNSSGFRRTLAGVSLILAPLLLLLSELVNPSAEGEAGLLLVEAAGNSVGYYLDGLLGLAASILLVPAFLGIMHLLRGRGAVLGHVGGALAVVGAVGLAIASALAFVVLEMVDDDAERGEMIALLERLDDNTGLGLVFVLMLGLGFNAGPILLAAGLLRARAAPLFAAPVILVGQVVFVLLAGVGFFKVLAYAILAVGYGALGVRLLTLSDAEWDRAGTEPVPARRAR